jgi:replicative DNA helicase
MLTKDLKDTFGAEFQRQVLALMFQDPEFLSHTADALDPTHFDSRVDATYAEIFLGFAKKFPEDRLTKEVVFNEIGKLIKSKRIADEDKAEYVGAFCKIASPVPAPEYIKSEIQQFCLAKSMETELVASVDLLRKGKHREIVDRLAAAYTKAEGTETATDIRLVGSLEEHLKKLAEPSSTALARGISTGFPDIDFHLCRAGVGAGEMLVVCGSPGRGKSIWLANMAVAALLKGHDILYYTLEMSADLVMNRIDAMLTGVPFNRLMVQADLVAERWGIIQKTHKLGEIYLQDLPSRHLTPNMIRRHLAKYREKKINHSLLIVDYADIMASDKKIDERRLEHGDVYEQLRGIAKEQSIAVVTASQANRGSLSKRCVDLDSMAEDFSKAMTADYVIGLSQTKSEETDRKEDLRGTGTIRAFFGKNRNGPKGVEVSYMTDFVKSRFSIGDMDRFDLDHYGKIV